MHGFSRYFFVSIPNGYASEPYITHDGIPFASMIVGVPLSLQEPLKACNFEYMALSNFPEAKPRDFWPTLVPKLL